MPSVLKRNVKIFTGATFTIVVAVGIWYKWDIAKESFKKMLRF